MTGTVEHIRGKGAYCFVRTKDYPMLFAHKSSFLDPEAMYEGQKVSFEVIDTPKGPAAMNIQSLKDSI